MRIDLYRIHDLDRTTRMQRPFCRILMAAAVPKRDLATPSKGSEAAPSTSVEDVQRPLDLSKVARGWHSANREYSYWVPEADVEGTIPQQLRGTLLRNGPGLLEVYGKKLIHRKSTIIYNGQLFAVRHAGIVCL